MHQLLCALLQEAPPWLLQNTKLGGRRSTVCAPAEVVHLARDHELMGLIIRILAARLRLRSTSHNPSLPSLPKHQFAIVNVRLWHLRRLAASENFNETWVADNSCYGHNPDDKQPFHNLFIEDTATPAKKDEKYQEVCFPEADFTGRPRCPSKHCPNTFVLSSPNEE